MKVAITGHTAGIGEALAQQYASRGHEVIGLSRRTGFNIRSVPKVAEQIEPCDVFINNAQVGFAQTELLFEVHRRWAGSNKRIIVISTMMTQDPVSVLPGLDEYRIQKVALEQAVIQLRNLNKLPEITIVRPGAVATQPGQDYPEYANRHQWAEKLINILESADPLFTIPDISLGPKRP
jgi:nucleoside-diphosphate-sugar epimerase